MTARGSPAHWSLLRYLMHHASTRDAIPTIKPSFLIAIAQALKLFAESERDGLEYPSETPGVLKGDPPLE
eukprot:1346270-Amorphochlora_amoeboformis.AAC.1